MKTFFLGQINEESYKEFTQRIEKEEGEKRVVLNSGGGSTSYMWIFLSDFHKYNIHLVGCVGVYSAGFGLFCLYRGPKYMVKGLKGMTHYGKVDCYAYIIGEGKHIIEGETKAVVESESVELDIQMTKKEKQRYKKNEDVYFNFDRMREIFPDVEII